jgi:hypothetical protein|tara:strand:+ start:1141 stop:1638 length:498 start_codon:yes stop_codon:yes gene_type:complete
MAKKAHSKKHSNKKRGEKIKRTMKRKGNNNKRSKKKRKSYKNMNKRKLKITLRRAKRKIQHRLKNIMKGGGKVETIKEVPQDPNQSPDSIEATKGATEVANQANVFNELEPNVVEPYVGMSSGNHSVFSSEPYSLLLGGGKNMPRKMKKKRKTLKKRIKLIKRKH